MKRYEVLMAKKLFPGSDIVRGFGYRAALYGTTMPIFGYTDCFGCCSPRDSMTGSMAGL